MQSPRPVHLAAALAGALGLLHAARAAAFFDVGTEAILANLLGNSLKQLSTAKDTLGQLVESNAALRRLADDQRAADAGARAFQGFAARRFASGSIADVAATDREAIRRDAFERAGVGQGPWAQLERACADAGSTACTGGAAVRKAVSSTFGSPQGAAREVGVVDGEVAAAIEADLVGGRSAASQEARLSELAARCSAVPASDGDAAARGLAEQCALASQLSEVLHLGEGQRANGKLAEIARLQALGIEQRNADLKRELLEREARRSALATGIEYLARSRVAIRTGGLGP